MTDLRLALLGPPLVERDGQAVAFDTRKAMALLALLAVNGAQSRSRLAATLWPDSDDFRARAALRRTLSVLAAPLRDALVVTRQAVALRPEALRVDLHDFENLLDAGDAPALERAVRLYRDDFMAGFGLRDSPEFDDWQGETAERFRLKLASALERLVWGRVAQGDLGGGLDIARRWLLLDQLHEPAHQALIRLYAENGQRSAALRQYRTCVGVLDRELGVAPLPATTKLYEEVLAGAFQPTDAEASRPGLPRRSSPGPASGDSFVARKDELAALWSSWREVGEQGRAVALVGEPGSGKSSLVSNFCQSVQAAGAPVGLTRGHEGETDLPYVVIADLLRVTGAARPELARRLPHPVRLEVSRLVPDLASTRPASAPAMAGAAGLARLYAAIAATLKALFADRPGVVVIEDLQHVDQRTLDVVAYLVRRLTELPLLLVLTWSSENAERLRGVVTAVADATDARRAWVEHLRPFGPEEVRDLLDAIGAPTTNLERILEETRGLPLLVRAYGDALVAGDSALAPPASAREVFLKRLAAVGQPTAQLLSAAAVLGRGFDAELLRAVSGRSDGELVDGLEIALGRALLIEAPPRDASGVPTYDFPYEALRRVAYDATSLARRRLVHGRAADVLLRRYQHAPGLVRAATVAYHLQEAGREGEAAQWWWAAAERSRALYAHTEALAHIAQARALGYPEAQAQVAAGDVLITLGRYREARQAFEAAASRLDSNDLALAEVEHRLADVHHRLGEWPLAASHLRAANDLLPPGESSRRARLEGDLALVAYRQGDFVEARARGEEALRLADLTNDAGALAQATNVLGVLAARNRHPKRAETLLRRSLEHAGRIADPVAAVAAHNNLSRLLADTGRLDQARAEAERALQLGIEQGDRHRVAALHTNLADLLQAGGQHEAALAEVKLSARLFAEVDPGEDARPEIWALVEW